MRTLFLDRTGPLMRYGAGTLFIDDLNPEAQMTWKLSRWELFKIGVRTVWAAVL